MPCDHCDKKFATQSILNTHMKRVHVQRSASCPYPGCKFRTKLKYNIPVHIQQVHEERLMRVL